MNSTVLPLKGRIILDCSTLLPGPFIGKLLALRGARVLKIENPDRPDPTRALNKIFYDDLNSCKEIAWINLTKPDDQERFKTLIKTADGLIEGFRPNAKKKLGLDDKTLHQINPKLCIVSLIGYPEDGPWRDRAGHDLNFQAVTGCLSLFSEMPALPLADLFAAYDGAFAMTALLDSTGRGNPGQKIAISLSETLRQVQSVLISQYRETRIVPRPGETLFSGQFPCYRIYKAKDGRRIAVGAIENKFWQKLCETLGHPEQTDYGYAAGKQAKETIAVIQKAFESEPWEHWAKKFESADCCVEPVLDYSEVYSSGV